MLEIGYAKLLLHVLKFDYFGNEYFQEFLHQMMNSDQPIHPNILLQVLNADYAMFGSDFTIHVSVIMSS